MRLANYEHKDGYRVVLSNREREQHYERIDSTTSKIGWGLAAYGGLRRQEAENVRYKDVRKRDTGDYIVRVYEDGAKRSKYRETPIPSELAVTINTIQDTVDVDPDDRVVDHHMRTVARHVQNAAKEMEQETNDEGWRHLGLHDGRRTWANSLLDDDVSPMQVMQWGGWDDWRTFRDHYLQDFSEEHQSEEMSKVVWL